MPFNLLLLPLLGGYVFVTHWHNTKFQALRSQGYHLLFKSALWGFVFLLASYLLTRILSYLCPPSTQIWTWLVPFPYSGTSICSLLLRLTLWAPLNWFSTRDDAVAKAIDERGDPLELLLRNALADLVLVTLRSGKVYIGWITSNFNPAYETKSILLLPAHSGHRDKDTLEVEFTTDYLSVYERYKELVIKDRRTLEEESELSVLEPVDFEIAIPISEVVSVSQFNPEVYKKYFHPRVEWM